MHSCAMASPLCSVTVSGPICPSPIPAITTFTRPFMATNTSSDIVLVSCVNSCLGSVRMYNNKSLRITSSLDCLFSVNSNRNLSTSDLSSDMYAAASTSISNGDGESEDPSPSLPSGLSLSSLLLEADVLSLLSSFLLLPSPYLTLIFPFTLPCKGSSSSSSSSPVPVKRNSELCPNTGEAPLLLMPRLCDSDKRYSAFLNIYPVICN
mmetsp:Transcript_19413/g.26942  ORF Transcript_19413/g.26942 Transcript_19413/m.26942 type:complete len:208 (+) Transcript_19413:171-794(+)